MLFIKVLPNIIVCQDQQKSACLHLLNFDNILLSPYSIRWSNLWFGCSWILLEQNNHLVPNFLV
uniref:Uncharacterized protein n=1 Tax=Arundo donax TaxID=35708 RepID=A0A0A9BP13_ARUDO